MKKIKISLTGNQLIIVGDPKDLNKLAYCIWECFDG